MPKAAYVDGQRKSSASGRVVKSYQRNKTLYLTPDDAEVWDRAAKLVPYHLNMSVSAFCTGKIRAIVEELEKKRNVT